LSQIRYDPADVPPGRTRRLLCLRRDRRRSDRRGPGWNRASLAADSFSASNGGEPFAGDGRLLTTISPTGDGLRDGATIGFTLNESATATLEVRRSQPPASIVFAQTRRLLAGPNAFRWAPSDTAAPGTYLVRVLLRDAGGNRRVYDVQQVHGRRTSGTPVVRVLGIDASFTRESQPPGCRVPARRDRHALAHTRDLSIRAGADAQLP